MSVIGFTSAVYTGFEKIYNADGTVDIFAIPHGDLVANTTYKVIINEFGYVTAAMADDTTRYYIGVPYAAVDSSEVDRCRLQIGGNIAAMVTPSLTCSVGHALAIDDGAIADEDADYTGISDQFAVVTAASSASETQAVMLIPEMVIGT